MKRPVIKQLEMLENGNVYISWSKCDEAQRYVIKKSEDENADFEDVARINAEDCEVIDENIDPQKLYWYRVIACRKNEEETELKRSKAKVIYTLKESKVELVDVTTDAQGVSKLKWRKFDNVDGYAVFKRNEHATNPVCVKTVDKNITECEEDTSILGTINYYSVKAFIIVNETRVYIAGSNECVSASVGKTKFVNHKKTISGKLMLTVSIVSGASGYIIKEQAENNEFKEILRSSSNTQIDFDYKPKSKTSLKFVALAYKNVGEKVIYSEDSEVISVN